MNVIIVGGGAAGFFTAINIAEKNPNWNIEILEKSNKLLSKVKVSGGGRCNVTNARSKPSELIHFYPRGHKKLYNVFSKFNSSDMVNWLRDHGVETHTESDLRMFPVSNNSQTIIDCFVNTAREHGVKIRLNCGITKISRTDQGWSLQTADGVKAAQRLIVTTGSSPQSLKILHEAGLDIVPPVPSLFTFNIKDNRLNGLMGITFAEAKVKIAGSKMIESGPLLITHWGLSGPAILKLSAWGARDLEKVNYNFQISISFVGELGSEQTKQQIIEQRALNPKRKVLNYPLFDLPKRFWEQICSYCEINDTLVFGELPNKQINKLTEELTQGLYSVKGKSTFKEEFVTSGGVKLSEINLDTFEAKRLPGLYLAGEVLDIDALTGGFNFQACWSGGWMIAQNF